MLPGERSQRRAAWLFLAPALILIGVFFFLPVAAGLALSVTDFDLYAIVMNPGDRQLPGRCAYLAEWGAGVVGLLL